jgi:hypothetical protein
VFFSIGLWSLISLIYYAPNAPKQYYLYTAPTLPKKTDLLKSKKISKVTMQILNQLTETCFHILVQIEQEKLKSTNKNYLGAHTYSSGIISL